MPGRWVTVKGRAVFIEDGPKGKRKVAVTDTGSVPERHRQRIEKQTERMNPAMRGVMGGAPVEWYVVNDRSPSMLGPYKSRGEAQAAMDRSDPRDGNRAVVQGYSNASKRQHALQRERRRRLESERV